MSLSIDDLVSSLSSSHIGQEAIDLAALQAQLAQTLFGQALAQASNVRQVPKNSSYAQPCTTPTFSSSFTLTAQVNDGQHQAASNWRLEGHPYDSRDDMEEDERTVEDLLVPHSPMSATPSAFQFSMPSQTASQSQHPSSDAFESAPSSFTSTDPFYIAQCQAQTHHTSPHSAFTQLGRPTQESPFTLPTSLQRREHPETSHSAPPLSVETHSFFMATSNTFDH